MTKATMHDGNTIDIVIQGEGPAILIPVNPIPVKGPQADEMRKWGADPALGQALIEGLCDKYRVITFDYEGHVLSNPKPDTLTPDSIAKDFIAIADEAGADRFVYYGYSWLALSGMQLALRTRRVTALIMGGFPPIHGPYKEMLQVTMATHKQSRSVSNPKQGNPESKSQSSDDYDWSNVEVTMNEGQTKQFVTLYQTLQEFNDREAQSRLVCPRLCFAGSADRIDYGEPWGNVRVDIVGPLLRQNEEIEKAGWDVRILEGLDHTGAMQAANVLPVLRSWLDTNLNGQ